MRWRTTMSDKLTAADALRKWQKQCDPEGIEVQVSRQALDEVLDALEAKDKEIELLEKGYDALLDDRNEAWERVAELEAALRDMFALIDEGFLCRDISRDAESGWAIKQLGFVQRLAKANQALGESDE